MFQKMYCIKRNLIGSIVMVSIVILGACGGTEAPSEPTETPTVAEVPDKPRKKLSAGERTFLLCQACHSLKEGEGHKVGPNLYGFLGSKAASKEGFIYSEALKNSNIVWDESHLTNWLEKPMNYIPGTTMAFVGIQDKEQQKILIEYLKQQTQ